MNNRELFVGVISGLLRVQEQQVSERLAEEERRIVSHSIAGGCPPEKAEAMLKKNEDNMSLSWFIYLARIFREDFVAPTLPTRVDSNLYENLPV